MKNLCYTQKHDFPNFLGIIFNFESCADFFFIRYCTLQGSILSLTLESWLYLLVEAVEAVEAEDKGVDCKAWSACGDRCQRPLRILLGNRCPYN